MRIEYFELISRIDAIDVAAGRIRTTANVPLSGTTFEGHFPNHPLMPGVLLIESMAQSCGHLLLATNGYTLMPFLVEVRSAKLRSFVPPGTPLSIEARIEHVGSGYAVAHADMTANGKRTANAELRFGLLPFPSDMMKNVMLDLVERLGLPRPVLEQRSL